MAKRASKKRLRKLRAEMETYFDALHQLATCFGEDDPIRGCLVDAAMKIEDGIDYVKDALSTGKCDD